MTVQAWGFHLSKTCCERGLPLNVRRQFSKFTIYPLSAFVTLLTAFAGCGQQAGAPHVITTSARGIVTDWTTRHVKFSNPGSEADSIKAGRHALWLRIMNDPRYQMQQRMRTRSAIVRLPGERLKLRPAPIFNVSPMHRDWASQIAPAEIGTAMGAFPAKYSFDINAAPNCSDYVVFPVDDGLTDLIGFNNLYDGICPSSAGTASPFAPTVQFSYSLVGPGTIESSPVLSEDGTKIAFVTYDYSSGVTKFHVLTLGTTGNNGTGYRAAATPCIVNGVQSCTTNNAVDNNFNLSIAALSSDPSSPFVDYSGDIAYVGDAAGVLHKMTGVFRGTPSEVTTSGWPFIISAGQLLYSPVYDSVSQHIFATSRNGNLYCIDVSSAAPALCSPTGYVSIANYNWVFDGPSVDSAAGTVFAEGATHDSTSSTLTQTTTSLGNVVQASMGYGGDLLYSGDFDNTYYSGNYSSGYLYFCGSTGVDGPTLYRIGFNSSGTMNSANDGNSYQLASSNYCTPLTETYNASQGKDYLFLGVQTEGIPAGCNGGACVMGFDIGSSFPSGPAATLPFGSTFASISGIVIDNVSNYAGASQLYFSTGVTGSAIQASQNGLN